MAGKNDRTPERLEINGRRKKAPLSEPEAQDAITKAEGHQELSIVAPDSTPKLMQQVAELSQEIMLLAISANTDPTQVDFETWQGSAKLCRLHVPPEKDNPISNLRETKEYLECIVQSKVRDLTQQKPGMPPDWIPKIHPKNGWMMYVAQLAVSINELSKLNKKTQVFLEEVKRNVKIVEASYGDPRVKMPASSAGGPRQSMDRAFALRVAILLAFPDEQPPPYPPEFEPWTEEELAQLFLAMGFKRLETKDIRKDLTRPEGVRELIKPYRRDSLGQNRGQPIPDMTTHFTPLLSSYPSQKTSG